MKKKQVIVSTIAICFAILSSCKHNKDQPKPYYPMQAIINGVKFNGTNCIGEQYFPYVDNIWGAILLVILLHL